jgi:hypothetical protein
MRASLLQQLVQPVLLLIERRLADILQRIRHPVPLSADLELVEMAIRPPERDLQDAVQFPER